MKLLLEEEVIFRDAIPVFKEKFGRKATVKEVVDWFHKINKRRWEESLLLKEPLLTINMINNGAYLCIYNDYILTWAAEKGCLNLVKLLVKKGLNIHYPNNYPLRCAVMNGHLKVVKFLVEKGAKTYAGYNSSLSWAAMNGHLKIVKFLVEKGVDVRASNDDALYRAAMNGHFKIVKFLRKNMRRKEYSI